MLLEKLSHCEVCCQSEQGKAVTTGRLSRLPRAEKARAADD